MNNQDIISRSALLKRLELVDMDKSTDFRAGVQFGVEHAIDVVKEVPTEDVVPVVHGEWRWAEDGHCKCTVCGQYATVKRVVIKTNFCPNCGAKMGGERKCDDA